MQVRRAMPFHEIVMVFLCDCRLQTQLRLPCSFDVVIVGFLNFSFLHTSGFCNNLVESIQLALGDTRYPPIFKNGALEQGIISTGNPHSPCLHAYVQVPGNETPSIPTSP